MTTSWACDPGGDVRPTTACEDIDAAIDARVIAEVKRHREYAWILGLNETETDARLDGIAVATRERCQAWGHKSRFAGSVLFARTMILSEPPLAWQIIHARERGFPVWSGAGRCEGPATLEVYEREMQSWSRLFVQRWGSDFVFTDRFR